MEIVSKFLWIDSSFWAHFHYHCHPKFHISQHHPCSLTPRCTKLPILASTLGDADARSVTLHKSFPRKSQISWTKLISENTKCGKCREALQTYEQMREAGVMANTYTFVAALKACASVGDLQTGKHIHGHVIDNGVESHLFVANALINMYAKCGSMEDAGRVFDRMPARNVVSWTAMILGYAHMKKGELALQLFARMRQEGIAPDDRTFVAALKGCVCLAAKEDSMEIDGKLVKLASLKEGKSIHSQIVKLGFSEGIFVATTLVDMYAKCGSMEDARLVFEKMPSHNVVSWSALILGYAHMEEGEQALRLYARMRHEGIVPNARTFVGALKACVSLAAKEEGKDVGGKSVKLGFLNKCKGIHSQIEQSGFHTDTFVANSLVDMYAKCGSIKDARHVFDTMPFRDVVSWNTMILGYAQMEEAELALELYGRMHHEGIERNARTFVAALKACTFLATKEEGEEVDGKLVKVQSLKNGKCIHSQVVQSGLIPDIFVATTLVDMYAKCGSMEDAHKIFDRMPLRNVVSWTAMILGYALSEEGELALQLYERMQHEGIAPNDRTFVGALKACGSLAAQEQGKEVDGKLVKVESLKRGKGIHSQAAQSGFILDRFVANSLVDMYAKCGSMEDAHEFFDRMSHRDVVSWNTIIVGYAQMEEPELALQLYTRMQHEGVTPDDRTFVGALMACSSLAAQEEGTEVDGKVVKYESLKKGKIIHSQVAQAGFISDTFVATTLVDMYAKCGSMDDARQIFDKMPLRDVVLWNAMIQGYAQMEDGEVALQLYACMQHEGIAPTARTFVAALKACGCVAALETGKKIHAEIPRIVLENDLILMNSILDMYSKCGSMVDAQQLFDALCMRDLVTWNALIAGFSRQGDSEHVFNLFQRMHQEGIQPDKITFLSILNVCSHIGLVDEGRKFFQAMSTDYGIIPTVDHYNCMVDLLGRAGQLDEAVTMVRNMPFQPDIATWRTILSACQKWNNVEVGKHAFECAVRVDDSHAAAYALMSNTSINQS